jgi:hypothetical protein
MSKKRNNEYWLGKIKLWFTLRGGKELWNKTHTRLDLCEKCRYYQPTNKVQRLNELKFSQTPNGGVYRNFEWVKECVKKKNFRGRLMVKGDLSEIRYWNGGVDYDFFCAEWIKDV